jgi:hypothetical protein
MTLLLTGCPLFESKEKSGEPKAGRSVIFIGVDISGSFKNSKHYKDAMAFTAHYIYAHLKGHGGLEIPDALFVGSIGGAKANEPKTFFPIQTFQYKSLPEIQKKLAEIFPARETNKFTDFNAFFQQIAVQVQNRKLIMRPIDIVLISDGVPDAPKVNGKHNFRSLKLEPFETLSRNITVRLLYTSAVTGQSWQTQIPRKRVRVWTQDANVMKDWNSKDIMVPGRKFEKQDRFFSWVKDNVDFPVKVTRIE